ncbi:hypothetical protein IKD82_01810 [Candidatus Saccharibacteria bacterium]|nr:hypothetical protein [Candidatus Saccharibacteria bacterium]
MPLKDPTGNMIHTDFGLDEKLNSADKTVSSVLNVSGKLQNFFGGNGEGFAGMNTNDLDKFKTALDTYQNSAKDYILQFNQHAKLDTALKGDVATAVNNFLNDVKKLLYNYIEALDIEKKEIDQAANNWLAASSSLSSDISADADTIRGAADELVVD